MVIALNQKPSQPMMNLGGFHMNTHRLSKKNQPSTEIINGVTVTNTTGQKGGGGRIIPWKGLILPKLRQNQLDTESEE